MTDEPLELILREATIEDLDAIADMALTEWPDNFQGGTSSKAEALQWTHDNFAMNKWRQYLVLEVEGEVVGYTATSANAANAGVVTIFEHAKKRSYTQGGVGKILLGDTENYWQQHHEERFGTPLRAIWVFSGGAGAHVAKKHLGYTELGDGLHGHYKSGEERLVTKLIV